MDLRARAETQPNQTYFVRPVIGPMVRIVDGTSLAIRTGNKEYVSEGSGIFFTAENSTQLRETRGYNSWNREPVWTDEDISPEEQERYERLIGETHKRIFDQ